MLVTTYSFLGGDFMENKRKQGYLYALIIGLLTILVCMVIADGFVGNVILKMAEAMYRINNRLTPFKPWLLNLLRPMLEPVCPKLYYHQNFWNAMNYESVGGTIVIGVNAPVMIGHGGSSAKAICSLILTMERNIKSRVCDKIREALKDVEPATEE